MKWSDYTFILLPLVIVSLFLLTACDDGGSKKKKSPAVGAGPASNNFVEINGLCYDNNQGHQVDYSHCANQQAEDNDDDNVSSTPGFERNDAGECIELASGLVVLNSYCDPITGGGGSGSGPTGPIYRQCQGWYTYPSWYGSYTIYCSAWSCRGMMLVDGITGRQIICQ